VIPATVCDCLRHGSETSINVDVKPTVPLPTGGVSDHMAYPTTAIVDFDVLM
ncbi:hypothetical protein A2U01_0063569, partial [Trifolium medium]|nr:hypothetical protein [Trifolium medium]